jgi:hypothetical protein
VIAPVAWLKPWLDSLSVAELLVWADLVERYPGLGLGVYPPTMSREDWAALRRLEARISRSSSGSDGGDSE